MKIGIVGPTYQANSLPFNAERSVNIFPVLDQEGKEVAAMYGTPGNTLFGSAMSAGACRGSFFASNGRGFVVVGAALFEVDAGGNFTSRGTLNQSGGNVSIDENGIQLGICDGTNIYIFTYSSNAFALVTDPDLPSSVGAITFIDGYFVVNQNGTGKFWISALYDGTSWDALDFATAESSPDNLLRAIQALGQLWLLGDKTSEVWTDTGALAFPFQKIAGAKLEIGILSPLSAIVFGEALYWVGKDAYGKNGVYQAQGLSPTLISTEAINIIIGKATDPTNIVSYAYQEQDHGFVVFTGGGLPTTIVYDPVSQYWHERAYLNINGEYETHIASCSMFAFGKHLIGDRRNSNLYEQRMDLYSDNGENILRERIYTHISKEGQRVRYNRLQVGFETGVGLQSGQGSDPIASLSFSKDGGRTYGPSYTKSIGKIGEYLTDVTWKRLGIIQQLTFRLRISDPVKIAICGSYLS